ncbi:hypothetical protein AB0J82_22275 [Asanoa sp. NPDC049518]|uniref:hypothetical protein n=1 Tax=unclassified Asanoa TaxID=2685164 RepID=UPI003447B463
MDVTLLLKDDQETVSGLFKEFGHDTAAPSANRAPADKIVKQRMTYPLELMPEAK